MQIFFRLIIVLFIVGLTTACRSTKKIQTAISKKDSSQLLTNTGLDREDSIRTFQEIYHSVEKNRIKFTTFSAKLKVDFEGNDGKKSDFNAFVRLYRDSLLWVSINAVLGIEAFRILITPDSVKVLNKLEKIAQLRSVNFLQEITRIPLTFSELQDILVGNPIFLDSNIVSYKKDPTTVSIMSIGEQFKHLLTVGLGNYKLLYSKLDDVDAIRARTAYIRYDDYESKNGINFSTFRKITVSEKSKLDIELKYKQFEFNEPLNFPFGIPRNYKLQ